MPYFLLSTPREISRKLLLYRYNQLPKAIENARKLGFGGGAALYPMVTIHGEECHNEWEITFEEIHRNNIIVYAIMQFSRVTGNKEYIAYYGLEVMIAISRFWSQRVSFSEARQKYVLLGVTGPNEYENNVNNNWYTNYSCVQCLQSTIECLEMVAHEYPEEYNRIRQLNRVPACRRDGAMEGDHRENVSARRQRTGYFVQDDGYPDKVLGTVDDIPVNDGRSTNTGRGTGFCARATSSKAMCCWDFSSIMNISTGKPSVATSGFTNPEPYTNLLFRLSCMPFWLHG